MSSCYLLHLFQPDKKESVPCEVSEGRYHSAPTSPLTGSGLKTLSAFVPRNFVQSTMSIERKKIIKLLREKRKTCKICSGVILGTIEQLVISCVSISEGQSNIFFIICFNCTTKRQGQLFVCISCGRFRSRSAKMICNNGCKCFVEHDPLHAANFQHPSESVTRHYCKNQEGSKQDLCMSWLMFHILLVRLAS